MSETSATILADSLKLPPAEREEVAAALWDSLNLEVGMPEAGDDELLAESDRRRAELLSGEVGGITHEELKSRIGR